MGGSNYTKSGNKGSFAPSQQERIIEALLWTNRLWAVRTRDFQLYLMPCKKATSDKFTNKLWENDLVIRPDCQKKAGLIQNALAVQMLSDRGADYLRVEGYYLSGKDYSKLRNQKTIRNFNHNVELSHAMAKLYGNARDKNIKVNFGWDLIESEEPWKLEGFVAGSFDTSIGKLYPDMTLTLTNEEKKKKLIFVEVDMNTEPNIRNGRGSSMQKLIRKYIETNKKGSHTKKYGTKGMFVHILTTSQQKIDNVIKLIEKENYNGNMFRLGTFKDYESAENVMDMMWTTNKREKVSLL